MCFSMSEFQFPGIANLEPTNFSSSIKTMNLVTHKGPTIETTKRSIEGVVDSMKAKVLVLVNTRCFIEISTTLTWKIIFKHFVKCELP